MTNKELIQIKLKEMDQELGCYTKEIEKLSKKELNNVLGNLSEECTDVDVKIGKQAYVVEIHTVDNEKDIIMHTKEKYISMYGNERYEKE